MDILILLVTLVAVKFGLKTYTKYFGSDKSDRHQP